MTEKPGEIIRMENLKVFPLKESKFYELCRSVSLMNDLVPDVRVQMIAESEIQETAPRSSDRIHDTRILINYTNERGNSKLFQITDMYRLTDTANYLDIDKFLSEYDFDDSEIEDPIIKLKMAVVSSLTYSLVVCLGLSDEKETNGAHMLAEWFVRSAVSVMYDDPLDVLILLRDQVLDNGAVVTVIDKMWVVKVRPQQGV